MRILVIAALAVIASVVAAQNIVCFPTGVQTASSLYIAYNKAAYKYSLPDLNLKVSKNYNQYLCSPGSFGNNLVRFAAGQQNSNSTSLNADTLAIVSQSNSAAPYPSPFSTDCVSVNGNQYCFNYANNVASVEKKSGNNVVETLRLPVADASAYFIIADPDVSGRIHLATRTCQGRGCSILTYYAISTNPLRIYRGPKQLAHTVGSGCPVQPNQCGVDVLLSINVRNDIVSYIWSILENSEYKVTVVSYDARCDVDRSVRIGSSLAAATRCNSPTSGPTNTPTRNCWTCPAGYVHWYDIQGYPEPADKCACVIKPNTPTARNCWTCPAGYVHWYDIQGYPEPADKCACVIRNSATTKAPTRNCWTCPAGYVHWYDIPNYPEPADKCACVIRNSATTKAPTRNCWTCPAGYVHWYDVPNMAEPSDKCACVIRPNTPTARNCWTCPAGFVHWYDVQGMPEPADKCACVRSATAPTARNCWTCPAGYVHWYDIPNHAEPADKCACVPNHRRLSAVKNIAV